MGTDIHIQVQQQADGGVWIDYRENPWAAADAAIAAWAKAWLKDRTYTGPPRNHPLDRDYALWGWLFGVRKADGVGVFPLRGLPEGMTADSREREFAEMIITRGGRSPFRRLVRAACRVLDHPARRDHYVGFRLCFYGR